MKWEEDGMMWSKSSALEELESVRALMAKAAEALNMAREAVDSMDTRLKVATEEGHDLEAEKLRMELHKASGELRKCGYDISDLRAWRAVEDTKHYIKKN